MEARRHGPTSFDVAQRAQVSQATVSSVLNHSRYVSPELVQRVERAIAELGYQPNAAARTLRTGRSGVIGLVVPSIVSPYWSSFVRSVSRAARDRGLSLLLAESDEDDRSERASLSMLLERQIDGLLLVTRSATNREFIAQISERRMPVVLVDSHLEGLALDSVTIDTEEGAYLACRHLITHGRQRLGLVCFPQDRFGTRSIQAGYAQALREAGLSGDPDLVRYAGFSEVDGYHAAQALLALPQRPDSLLVVNHLMTIGALHATSEAGLLCPDDLALIGFDDTPWAAWLTPPLSLVDDPKDELGVRVIGALLRRLQQPGARPRHQVLRTRLVLRRSCGCSYDPMALPTGHHRAVRAPATAGRAGYTAATKVLEP